MAARLGITGLLIVVLSGCGMPSLEEQTKKSDSSIIGKKTQDIGEHDPDAGKNVSDSKIRATDPISAPVQAYGPMVEQISKSQVAHALNLYHATNGEYPQTHEEFMTHIIKANNIQLPVLPGGKKYEYDVENHELVVVDAEPAAEAAEAAEAGNAP